MSKFTFRELDTAHKKSFQNEPLVKIAKDCACFHCLEHFKPSEIKDWVDDKIHRTAICPKCSVDSVLTEEELDKVQDELLSELHLEYFGGTVDADEEVLINKDNFIDIFEVYEKDNHIRLFEADLVHADRAEKAKK